MLRVKTLFGFKIAKPKDLHSAEHLKYLYHVLLKNQTVTEANRNLLVETLRSISEILIWGDQNDNSVFDFFLEKNMLSFFLKIMAQKCGSYVCVQLLQTLNILFENIRNETSVYYLLSNNHINSIIVHKFDFSDEEVMAYYISFLKTLSLKLSDHTIHFFFNETTNDFPLYTEALKFFNHPEKMVRIAVRTITLNVFKVEEKAMLKFVTDKTAAPYFSNLVWFIGSHVLEIESCLAEPQKTQQLLLRLGDLIAEHLDHLHYLNDIFLLRIDDLNMVLTDHFLNRLLIPLYIYSLVSPDPLSTRPRISQTLSLFLLSQVFHIIAYESLVQSLIAVFFNDNPSIIETPEFAAPAETLEESLVQVIGLGNDCKSNDFGMDSQDKSDNDTIDEAENLPKDQVSQASITDEEKAAVVLALRRQSINNNSGRSLFYILMQALDCNKGIDDQTTILSICLLHAIIQNPGINKDSLYDVIIFNPKCTQFNQNDLRCIKLVDSLVQIMHLACQNNGRIRLITLEMSIILFKKLAVCDKKVNLSQSQLDAIENSIEKASKVLGNFFQKEDENLFLEMFEDESFELQKRRFNVEYLMKDPNLLLPSAQITPLLMNEQDFSCRLPCNDVERTRYAIRVFLLLRQLSLSLKGSDQNPYLPSSAPNIEVEQSLDLNNSDLIAATVILKDQSKSRRFMVIDSYYLILVEPDLRKIGWGIVKFIAPLQDIEINCDEGDARSLIANIRKSANVSHTPWSSSSLSLSSSKSNLTLKFIFDDHIRCMAAKQRLSKGRLKARQRRIRQIARLIDVQNLTSSTQSKKLTNSPHQPLSRSKAHKQSERHVSPYQSPNLKGQNVPGFAALANSCQKK